MSDETVPLTKLEAVNMMLGSIGRLGVMSLDSADTDADSELAQQFLTETLKAFQSEGWHFNTEKVLELQPGEDGRIALPANTLKVDTVYASKADDLTQRGGYFYDRVNHTFIIEGPVSVDLVVALPFEDLTQTARWYVSMSAARRFATKKLNSLDSYRFTKEDEDRALQAFKTEDTANDDRTLAESNPHIARMRRK